MELAQEEFALGIESCDARWTPMIAFAAFGIGGGCSGGGGKNSAQLAGAGNDDEVLCSLSLKLQVVPDTYLMDSEHTVAATTVCRPDHWRRLCPDDEDDDACDDGATVADWMCPTRSSHPVPSWNVSCRCPSMRLTVRSAALSLRMAWDFPVTEFERFLSLKWIKSSNNNNPNYRRENKNTNLLARIVKRAEIPCVHFSIIGARIGVVALQRHATAAGTAATAAARTARTATRRTRRHRRRCRARRTAAGAKQFNIAGVFLVRVSRTPATIDPQALLRIDIHGRMQEVTAAMTGHRTCVCMSV